VLAVAVGCVEEARHYIPVPPTVPQLRLPRNDVYQGAVLPGALRPTFKWEPSTVKAGAITYELQYSADSKFETGVVTETTTEPTFRPAENLAIATTPPVGRRYYWRVRACLPQSCSDYSPTWWINLGRSKKDFNGDGYADVAVGTQTYQSNVGIVEVYFGGPGIVFDSTNDGRIMNPGTGMLFGRTVAAGGDFNSDGFGDLLAAGGDRVYLFYGGPGSTFNTFPDVVFQGTSVEGFGDALAFVGDLNGDGASDVAIGAPRSSARAVEAGRTYVYLSSSNGGLDVADGVLDGDATNEHLGNYISGGDVNGDGFADVVNSAGTFYDEFHEPPCHAKLYWGGPGQDFDASFEVVLVGGTSGTCSFRAVAAGDLDHDGYTDVVAGFASTPQLLVYRGGQEPKSTPTQSILIPHPFSLSISGAGDVNGDNFDDVAITGDGPTLVYLGKSDGSEALLATPTAGEIGYEGRVAAAGD
jgi:FG-GAP repeat